MGYEAYAQQYSAQFSYSDNARAKIFRREQSSVQNLTAMQRFIRFNKWQTDPFSEGYAGFSISARYDLQLQNYPNVPVDWFRKYFPDQLAHTNRLTSRRGGIAWRN